MGTVTANADCTVLAALCISRTLPEDVPNLKSDLLADNYEPVADWSDLKKEQCAVNTSRSTSTPGGGYYKQCNYPGGFYEDSVTINKPDWIDPTSEYFAWAGGNYTGGAWFYDTRKAYLLEWHSGTVSATPDAAALVNSAIGGARYGSFELHINADASLYFVDMKCVIFGRGDLNFHEGDCSLNVRRTTTTSSDDVGFEWFNDPLPASSELVPVGSGWGISCGFGHTTWNVASYNRQLDQWGRWCWSDGNGGADTGYPARGFSAWFRVAGEAAVAEVWRIFNRTDDADYVFDDVNGQYGQPSDIATFGTRGWVGVLTAYVPGSMKNGVVGPTVKIGIAHLPASGGAGMIAAGDSGGSNSAVHFIDKLAPDGKSVGWAKLVHIGNDPDEDRFLLGYAITSLKGSPDWYDWPEQFMLVEVSHDGKLLTVPHRVDNTGWSQQSTWTVLEGGCVIWPNVWADATDPLGRGPSNWYTEYGSGDSQMRAAGKMDSMYSSSLRLMTYCPDEHIQTAAPTAKPTAAPSRGPTDSPAIDAAQPSPATQRPTVGTGGFTVTISFVFSNISGAEARSSEFQQSLKSTIADATGVSADLITIVVAERRDASVSAMIQTPDEQAAARASNAVTAASNSGALVTSMNTYLAASSYSGSTVSGVVATATTSSNDTSGGSDKTPTVLIAVCVSVGAALLVAIALMFYWHSGRSKSLSNAELDIGQPLPKLKEHKKDVTVDNSEVAVDVTKVAEHKEDLC